MILLFFAARKTNNTKPFPTIEISPVKHKVAAKTLLFFDISGKNCGLIRTLSINIHVVAGFLYSEEFSD